MCLCSKYPTTVHMLSSRAYSGLLALALDFDRANLDGKLTAERTAEESECQWERSVTGTLPGGERAPTKEKSSTNLKTKAGHAGSGRIGSITGNVHVTRSMYSLTIDNVNGSHTKTE